MDFVKIKLGELETNCYILDFNNTLIIIDPAEFNYHLKMQIDKLLNKEKQIFIILTHNHFDHIGGVSKLNKIYKIKHIVMNKNDFFNLNNELYTGELLINKKIDKFKVTKTFEKDLEIKINNNDSIYLFHTPGHTKGSISIIYRDLLFSGDTLFKNAIGRYDLPSASYNDIVNSVKTYFKFNKNFYVYPGHGDSTKLYDEREWLKINGII